MKKSILVLTLLLTTLIPVSYCLSSEISQKETFDDLKYSVSKGGADEYYESYNIIKGIETINNTKKDYNLRIVSKDDIEETGTKKQKESLKLLDDLLAGKDIVNYEQYDFDNRLFNINSHVGGLFYAFCPDWGAELSGKISNVDKGKFDRLNAYYTLDGQDPPFGEITVVVFAQKGYDYFMFSAPTNISTDDKEGLANPAFDNCYKKYGYEDETRSCFVKSLKGNKQVQKVITDKANELIQSFPQEILFSKKARKLLAK